jgi:hypothetical protein
MDAHYKIRAITLLLKAGAFCQTLESLIPQNWKHDYLDVMSGLVNAWE